MRWLVALVVVVGGLAWAWQAERAAESAARSFCAGVAVGGALADVAELARAAGDDRLRRIDADSIAVGFTGIPPFSRHVCDVRGESGKVVSKRYVHLD